MEGGTASYLVYFGLGIISISRFRASMYIEYINTKSSSSKFYFFLKNFKEALKRSIKHLTIKDLNAIGIPAVTG
jgi:hypothetical protein